MMFQDVPVKKRKARKKRKRLPFEVKASHIIDMMTKNADALRDIHGLRGWGFTMSQIADMTAYERSTAMMNDLYRMVDAEMIRMHERPNPSCGISHVTYYFFTIDEYKYALKQGRLDI